MLEIDLGQSVFNYIYVYCTVRGISNGASDQVTIVEYGSGLEGDWVFRLFVPIINIQPKTNRTPTPSNFAIIILFGVKLFGVCFSFRCR